MSESKKGLFITYFFLILAMIFWGLSFVWYKQALLYFKPVSLVFARLVISFPLLALSAILLKRLKPIRREDIPLFLLLAFLEPFLYFLGEAFGMQYVSSTVAAILIATIPLFTSITAYYTLNEKLTKSNYLGMIISFAGVLAVIFSDGMHVTATRKGILLIMVAVFSAMGYGFLIKRISGKYNSLTIVSVQNFVGSIYFLPLFLIFDLHDVLSTNWSFEKLKPMLFLSLFASTFAYVGFIQGIRKLGVSKATVFANFIPVFTAIFAFFILGETLTLAKLLGIVLVVAGLILTQSVRKQKLKKPEDYIVNELY